MERLWVRKLEKGGYVPCYTTLRRQIAEYMLLTDEKYIVRISSGESGKISSRSKRTG